MAYKSILTVLTDDQDVDRVLDAVIPFARAANAHLDVLCLGVDHTQTGYYFEGATALVLDDALEFTKQEALKLEAAVRTRLHKSEISWGAEAIVTQTTGLSTIVSRRARFADLVILSKPYGEGHGADDPAVVETAMFQAQAPVLILADGTPLPATPKQVVLAWNESPEALSAARRALPFLKMADEVSILIIGTERHGTGTADPGMALATWLSRHGIKAEISLVAQTLSRVSDQINRFVVDQNADLLVMGAYGHSRFREAILGGATRNLLEHATGPVFLAH